jgi:Ser/Thr protein kinase RdoA (MazF antagonist)
MKEKDRILEQVSKCCGINKTQLRCLTDNPLDDVYGFNRDGQDFVVKFTLEASRSFGSVMDQIGWVNFLTTHGVPAARPVTWANGEFVQRLPADDDFASLVSYEFVQGVRPDCSTGTSELFQLWGRLLGRIHAQSEAYSLSQESKSIAQWHEILSQHRRAIPADQLVVIEKLDALEAFFRTLSTDSKSYGLIHGDFQANNLRLDGEILRVFDFDSCEHNWFAKDVATSLFYSLWERPIGQTNEEFGSFFLENVLMGYATEHSIGADWLESIPVFLKLEEMHVYAAINDQFKTVLRPDLEGLPATHRALLTQYRHNIERDVPYIDSAYCPWG